MNILDRSLSGQQYGADSVYKADTPEDLEALHRILCEVYAREFNWLNTGVTRMERDSYHPHSTYLIARAGSKPIGMMRLVHDSPIGLPIEQFVDVSEIKRGRTIIECQRLMVLSEYRTYRDSQLPFGAFGALVKATVYHTLVNRRDYIIADCFVDTPTTPVRQLKGIGFIETGKNFMDRELAESGASTALLLKMETLYQLIRTPQNDYFRYLTPRFDGFSPP
jgi:N-acyl amino acid synthase FeeM